MNKEEIEKILDEIYTEYEEDEPPTDPFVSRMERQFNVGLYRGRLGAMEKVTQRLLGKSGDKLTSQST